VILRTGYPWDGDGKEVWRPFWGETLVLEEIIEDNNKVMREAALLGAGHALLT
jgi:hypothetical protein